MLGMIPEKADSVEHLQGVDSYYASGIWRRLNPTHISKAPGMISVPLHTLYAGCCWMLDFALALLWDGMVFLCWTWTWVIHSPHPQVLLCPGVGEVSKTVVILVVSTNCPLQEVLSRLAGGSPWSPAWVSTPKLSFSWPRAPVPWIPSSHFLILSSSSGRAHPQCFVEARYTLGNWFETFCIWKFLLVL